MKAAPLFFAIGFLFAVPSVFAAQPEDGTWRFLLPGTTHSGESPIHPDKGWLALRKGKHGWEHGWELAKTEIKATKVASDITDYDIEIKSSHEDAIALFKLPQLSAGPVDTPEIPQGLRDSFFTKENGKYPLFRIQFNTAEYVFRGGVEKPSFPGNETITYDAAIVESGNRRSVIGDSGGDSTHTDSSNNSVHVVWVGDLDRDGKLDLITSFTGTNTSGLCLYLSSSATGKKLFGQPICHEGSGC